MSAAARFFAFRLWAVKMSSFRDLEGRGRAAVLVVGRVCARREESCEVKEREVEVEISCFGARVGRGMP